jgi:hypothetical protein
LASLTSYFWWQSGSFQGIRSVGILMIFSWSFCWYSKLPTLVAYFTTIYVHFH